MSLWRSGLISTDGDGDRREKPSEDLAVMTNGLWWAQLGSSGRDELEVNLVEWRRGAATILRSSDADSSGGEDRFRVWLRWHDWLTDRVNTLSESADYEEAVRERERERESCEWMSIKEVVLIELALSFIMITGSWYQIDIRTCWLSDTAEVFIPTDRDHEIFKCL